MCTMYKNRRGRHKKEFHFLILNKKKLSLFSFYYNFLQKIMNLKIEGYKLL